MNSNTGPRRLIAADKKARAIELRRAGHTLDEIGRQVGLTRQRVHKIIKDEMARLHAQMSQSLEEYRRQELERLDQLQAGVWDKAVGGDLKAIEVVVKISHHRSRLLGLEAATKVDQTVRSSVSQLSDQELAQIATTLGIAVDPEILGGSEADPPLALPFQRPAG